MFHVGYFLVLLSVLCVPNFCFGDFLNLSWDISYLTKVLIVVPCHFR